VAGPDLSDCRDRPCPSFRWDHVGRKVFRKFYGQDESSEEIPSDNRLYNDALQFGDEITREEYARGLPIKK
jgi:hypothetical protein